jgi:hypothetical protein
LLIGLSVAFLLHSVFLFAAVVAAAIHYCRVVVPAEERFLRRTVGPDAFDAYAARTPRWVPDFRLFTTSATCSFQAKALRKEAERAARLLGGGCLLTLLAAARCEAWWPQWFWLP